jgi:hypothetical protein
MLHSIRRRRPIPPEWPKNAGFPPCNTHNYSQHKETLEAHSRNRVKFTPILTMLLHPLTDT